MVDFLTAPILASVRRRQCREWGKCNIRYAINSSNNTVMLGCPQCGGG